MLIPNHVDPFFCCFASSPAKSGTVPRCSTPASPHVPQWGLHWDSLGLGLTSLPRVIGAATVPLGSSPYVGTSLCWADVSAAMGLAGHHLTLCWSAPPHVRRTQKVQLSTHTSARWQHIQVAAGWSYPTLLLSQAYGDKTWQKITGRGHSTSPRQHFVFLDCIYFSDTPTDTSCKLRSKRWMT